MQLKKNTKQNGMSALVLLFAVVILGATVLAGGLVTPSGLFPDAQKATNVMMLNPIASSQNGLQMKSSLAVTPTPTNTPTPGPTIPVPSYNPPPPSQPNQPQNPPQAPPSQPGQPPITGCTCEYSEACTDNSGQSGVRTCHGLTGTNSSNPSGQCGYDKIGSCTPSCNSCTINSIPTSAPTAVPPPPPPPAAPPTNPPPAPPPPPATAVPPPVAPQLPQPTTPPTARER